MRYLDKICVETTLTLDELMDTVEEAYGVYDRKQYYMPPRPSIEHKKKTLLYMPCFTEECLGTKILSVFPENRALGIPAIDGLMLLNDYETGRPRALLNGSALTAMRTGAVGGVAMRYLAAPDADSVGLVGTGTQGLHQLMYACAVRTIRDIYLFRRNHRDLTEFSAQLREKIGPEIRIHISEDIREVVGRSDIVITATTAESPVLPDDPKLLRGKCFIAIGSYKPNMRELPDALWQVCPHVYTELPFALEESGDLSQPLEDGILSEERVIYMSDYLKEKTAVQETVCFKSVGMAIFDLLIADKIARKAEEKNIGQQIIL